MKYLLIAPFEEPVPPKKYGGTELVVSNITEELVKRGNEVYLIASGDSTTNANLIPIVEKSLRSMDRDEFVRTKDYRKFAAMAKILQHIDEIKPDVVHNHLNWLLVKFSNFIDCPMISTVHGPATSVSEQTVYTEFAKGNYVSISDNQRKALPDINWVKTVYNGIDVDKFDFNPIPTGNYFVFLGRTTPEKGLAELCKMIKKTDHKLKIAAKIDPVDDEYFNNEIKPHIDGEQIEFLGEVDHAGKNALLKDAKGLMMWLNWEEPFGLVVIEAMACGTPVIINKRGSMPELIADGKTGYLVDTIDEMQAKLETIDLIDRAACRQHVEENFTVKTMTDGYIELAEMLIARKQ